MKIGIIDSFVNWNCFKQQFEMDAEICSKKITNFQHLPNLEDAKKAGTCNSLYCSLIVTEGQSATSSVTARLGVERDKFGIFSLRGNMLNVREASDNHIMANAEINNLVKILGLEFNKKYTSIDDLNTLRYGKVLIMKDQDLDGSHIAGLIINFFHKYWPSLINLQYLERIITPIVMMKFPTLNATTSNTTKNDYFIDYFNDKFNKNTWNKEDQLIEHKR
ncbi:dna topoisomerase 2-alpha-like protein [Dermatophagoides farinae]|uniref:DNA topoisomerase (ATP-hydrolyzing) n=1 Tax=Dermatophagoides farinae TaxID=6954 RepID=A0A9D4SEI3_DERFA|nr:dna topoisomerase 2-alpha-like protein [Dermatophagoides farinae]